ncbi:hypothetical protein CEP68_03675 [Brevundimonas vesicularis]|uniref:RNA polymerase sigma-70 region 2 domain-containing protein n=2 Tax=Brevundimonas vesicularis TaxID=41276 RepID=A0A1Z3U5V8_BREVE|nr:hypothetical protein CEP68_03675 [Brevundimonas vesicularis]
MLNGLDGDAQAWRVLLSDLAAHLRPFFKRRLFNGESDAEDLVQETLIAIHAKRATWDRNQSFTAWAFTIARHKLIDHLRRQGRRLTEPLDDASVLLAEHTVEDGVMRRDLTRALSILLTASQAQNGPPVDPLVRVMGYHADEWEKFIDEWVSHCLKADYVQVARFSGANDRGIDIAGFADAKGLIGVWDNYQCKHYGAGITPGTAWPEIGKILWHSFNGHYVPPRAYYFVAPRDTGTSLTQLLSNIPLLKTQLLAAWEKSVRTQITVTQEVKLEGAFADYVDSFDFTIFKRKSPREIIEQHRNSPYFIPRFGGGLPPRPAPDLPPSDVHETESG